MEALRQRQRTELLYLLSFATARDWQSPETEPALALAVRNDWPEVVDAVLEASPRRRPDGRDELGRSAASYAAGHGHMAYLKRLWDLDALVVDQADHDMRMPLHWAASAGHDDAARFLVRTGRVDHARTDVRGQTALSHAAKWP